MAAKCACVLMGATAGILLTGFGFLIATQYLDFDCDWCQ